MRTKDLLICGHRSFVATGLIEKVKVGRLTFDTFSRGEESRQNECVYGDVTQMNTNKYLEEYVTVVNFIILKDCSVEDNLLYIKALLEFCRIRHVKRLIQISSISVYSNQEKIVTEDTNIENDWHNKGGYASIKVAVDHYIEDNKPEGLEVVFVRPGFVYTKGHEVSKDGLFISKLGLNILFGDKKTTLPLVCREKLHTALLEIIKSDQCQKVYLVLNSNKTESTKYNFVCQQWSIKPFVLPSWLILPLAKLLRFVGLFKERHYLKVVGVFKRTWFDSRETENVLRMSFGKKRFAVLGAGTYGSYVCNLLSEVYPHENILLFDVGDEHLKTEDQIGFLSNNIGAPYQGLQKARFFGFGGASAKWGGQLLTFDDNDFLDKTRYTKDVIELDKKWKNKVLSRFGLENSIPDEKISDNMFIKTGIWLGYFHRNLFDHFRIAKKKQIQIVRYARVTKIVCNKGNVEGFYYKKMDGDMSFMSDFDQYFLTTGAFESCRILLNSGISLEKDSIPFSDHLSQRAFYVTSGPKMGGRDFTFRLQGTSLCTKRFIGEVDGYSFYSQPIFNEDFPFFKDLKRFLFGRQMKFSIFLNILKNIPSCVAFVWDMFILKKLYVYKNQFYLQIDIEAPKESGTVSLDNNIDKYGENGINVNFNILSKTGELFTKARGVLKKWLDENNVDYTELPFSTTAEKYEDVYHPFGMFCDFESIDEFFRHFDNMLVVNTGVLQRAGGINSTGAVFPLVEEYVNFIMK